MRKRYKIPLYALTGTVVLCGLAVGTLIHPGWNLTPLLGWVEGRMERALPGLDLEIGRAHVQLKGGREGAFSVSDVLIAESDGEKNLRMESAELYWPVGRLARLRVMPVRVTVSDCEVWISTDESGIPLPPRWLPSPPTTVAADQEEAAWAEFRLSSIPLIWKMEEGEQMRLTLVDYTAYLRQTTGEAAFSLPLLEVTLRGWQNGVHADWRAGEETPGRPRWVEGHLTADVPGETISWHNSLFLPLTPDLADWLTAGFPFLPVPSFFETQAKFQSRGETDLRAARTTANGTLSLAAGSLALPGRPELRMGIPPVSMVFESTLSYGAAFPLLHSTLQIALGEGERAAEIALIAEVNGGEDRIRLESTGALRYLEDLLALLPQAWQPLVINGDFSWEASLDTLYTEPIRVRTGKVALGSHGISLVFTGDASPTIDLASFGFSGQIEQAGQLVAIDPFHLVAGPIRIDGTGLRWDGSEPGEWGTGRIALAPLAIADVIALVPPALFEFPDEVRRWLTDTRIEKLALTFGFLPDEAGSLGGLRIRLEPEWEIGLAGMPLIGAGSVEGYPFARTAEAEITLARFNPAHLRRPDLEIIGRLDCEIEIAFRGTFDAIARVARMEGGLHASPGTFHPGEALREYFDGPIGIESASLEGHLHIDSTFSADARLHLATSLGHMEAEIRPEAFVFSPTLPETIPTEIRWALRPATTALLLPQVSAALRDSVGLSASELTDFDLRTIAATLQVPLSPATALPHPSAWTGGGEIEIRTGRESLSIEFFITSAIPEDLRLEWQARPWNPGTADLALVHGFGFDSGTLDLPLRLSGSVDLTFAGDWPVDLQPRTILASVAIHGEPGELHLPNLLKEPLPWSALGASLNIDPLGARIEKAGLRMETPFGNLLAQTNGLALAPALSGQAEVGIEGIDLAKVLNALAPETLAAANLDPASLRVQGTLERLQMRIEFGETPAAYPLPWIAGMDFDLRARGLRAFHSDLPELFLPRLGAQGRLSHSTVAGTRREALAIDLDMDGFLFPQFRLALHSRFAENFAGELAGCKSLRVAFRGMDGSDLQLSAEFPNARDWNVSVNSRVLNLAPLLLLGEGRVADLLRGSTADSKSSLVATAPEPKQQGNEPPPFLLPDTRVAVNLDRIRIGSLQEIGALRGNARMIAGWPHEARFSLGEGDNTIALTMEPNGSGWATTFSLGKVHHWIGVAVTPLHLYESRFFRTDEAVRRIRNLPDSFDQGDLRFSGNIALRPAFHASLRDISLAGLILRTEVTFLSRIAALVDRRVMLLVPFKEFRVASLTYSPEGLLSAHDIFIDGPINMALSLARFDAQSFDTLIQGRVFGIAFEVAGVAPDLSFYLQERPVIRAVTVQDDFDW